jgi:hypothetical protein
MTHRQRVLAWARCNIRVGGRTPRMSATCATDPSLGVSTWDVWESAGRSRNRLARVRVSRSEIEVID